MIRQTLPDGSINPEWVVARRGCLGASSIGLILKAGKKKDEPSATRRSLATKLAAEGWAQMAMDNINPENEDIARGMRNEGPALAEYEAIKGVIVRPAAWVEHPKFRPSENGFGAGATPDAFVGADGLAQVKSPRPLKMVTLMRDGTVPAEYVDQLDWELAVTGRQWNDLVLYNPELPPGRHIWIRRHYRNDDRVAYLEEQVALFVAEVEAMFQMLCATKFFDEETA